MAAGGADVAELLFGLHAVRAAARYDPGRVEEAWVERQRRDQRLRRLRQQLDGLGIPVHDVGRRELDQLTAGAAHQGVAARYAGLPPRDDDDLARLLDGLDQDPLLLVLDQVQDPHNLGACLRTAEAAGVQGVVAPRDRAVGLTPAVFKVASGAAQSVPFFQVINLARTLQGRRDRGLWVVGAAGDAATLHHGADLKGPLALVLGAEDTGLRRLTRERCDVLVRLPMQGQVESLNVSVAAGVLIYEALRQRGAA